MWLTVAQFRVPKRNVASNVAWSLAACAQRVASTFETAHTVLEFTFLERTDGNKHRKDYKDSRFFLIWHRSSSPDTHG